MQVVSVTSFNGGSDLNTVPESVALGGTFRAFSNTSFHQVMRRIEEVYIRPPKRKKTEIENL